ncbi:MAG TPA: alpha/beta fold hydrolase [Thermomicrobiales bacterium]|nr:alpha/beta fold hydrolase [Thermomicrobiales bacterium]
MTVTTMTHHRDHTMPQQSLPFSNPDHQPFDFAAEGSAPGAPRVAALLVHGFMGTPRELRPLGRVLAANGIRAVAPLLPGFGPQVQQLNRVRADQWTDAVDSAWRTVRKDADQTVLVGFSFGAALALPAAATAPPDALVLLAPYTRLIDLPSWLITAGMPVMKRTMKTFSPYAKADFSDPEVRRFFTGMDSSLDLDDPATQARLREQTSIPLRVIDQLRVATDRGRKAAPAVTAPTLLVQGSRDETSTVARSRALAAQLGGPLELREIDADHLIVDDRRPAWPALRDDVLNFIERTTGAKA